MNEQPAQTPHAPPQNRLSHILKKFIFFVVLIDDDVAKELNGYERSILYAAFMRQILSAAFLFIVFFYCWSLVMSPWAAFGLAAVLSLIFFFVDQAIAGTEWTAYPEKSAFWFSYNPLHIGAKIVQLLPRIVLTLGVIWLMSTMAEIALQRNAIARFLNESTKANNNLYFVKLSEQNAAHAKAVQALDERIGLFEAAILRHFTPTPPTEAQEENQTGLSEDLLNAFSGNLVRLQNARESLLKTQAQEKATLMELLAGSGYKNTADYDLLDLRIGLKGLYEDPIYGAHARAFSWQIRTYIFFFGITPIFLAIFFSPFSAINLKMRQRREDSLLDDKNKQRERAIIDIKAKNWYEVRKYFHTLSSKSSAKMRAEPQNPHNQSQKPTKTD